MHLPRLGWARLRRHRSRTGRPAPSSRTASRFRPPKTDGAGRARTVRLAGTGDRTPARRWWRTKVGGHLVGRIWAEPGREVGGHLVGRFWRPPAPRAGRSHGNACSFEVVAGRLPADPRRFLNAPKRPAEPAEGENLLLLVVAQDVCHLSGGPCPTRSRNVSTRAPVGRFSGVHHWPVLGVHRGQGNRKRREEHEGFSKIQLKWSHRS